MKLLFCPHCHDLRKLHVGTVTSCLCGKSSGQYPPDGVRVVPKGDAIPIGILNSSFVKAVKGRLQAGLGSRFDAFVIPMDECSQETFIYRYAQQFLSEDQRIGKNMETIKAQLECLL